MNHVSSQLHRVLVAEDDPAMREVLAEALAAAGLVVELVTDGEALLSRAEGSAVIVTDLRMPRLDGLTALARLRHAGVDRPVVMITGFGSPETHSMARALGAARVLDKPFDVDHLVDVVRCLLPTPT